MIPKNQATHIHVHFNTFHIHLFRNHFLLSHPHSFLSLLFLIHLLIRRPTQRVPAHIKTVFLFLCHRFGLSFSDGTISGSPSPFSTTSSCKSASSF